MGAGQREVEPYALTDGRQDLLVYCFQRDPEPDGYRSFMLHKIADAEITERMYLPRRAVTIDAAEIESRGIEPMPAWTDPARRYRDHITAIMADGEVKPEEIHSCLLTAREVGLSVEERDYVHASLFHRILGAVLDDGKMSDAERRQIRFMQRTLAALGYAPGA